MIACPACRAENPDAFTLCGRCGATLVAPAIRADERKVVTTLFCDLVAFTTMGEQADPEDVHALMRAYCAAVRRVIESHGGIVEIVTPATDILSPGVPGYVPGLWLYAKLDLAQAAALLTEAGYPGGAGLPEITFLTTDQSSKTEYKTDLAVLGVKVKSVEVSPAQFWPKWQSGRFMMCQDGWNWYPTAAAAPVVPISSFSRTVVCSAGLHDAVLSPLDLFDFTRVWIE